MGDGAVSVGPIADAVGWEADNSTVPDENAESRAVWISLAEFARKADEIAGKGGRVSDTLETHAVEVFGEILNTSRLHGALGAAKGSVGRNSLKGIAMAKLLNAERGKLYAVAITPRKAPAKVLVDYRLSRVSPYQKFHSDI